jgi:hypothetical protein
VTPGARTHDGASTLPRGGLKTCRFGPRANALDPGRRDPLRHAPHRFLPPGPADRRYAPAGPRHRPGSDPPIPDRTHAGSRLVGRLAQRAPGEALLAPSVAPRFRRAFSYRIPSRGAVDPVTSPRYASFMANELEHSRSRSPVVRKAVAAVVLVAAAALVVHLIIGFVIAIFWVVVVVAAVAAILWALKTLVW